MPLPKITAPTYELVLPSSDRKIRYRPFLVKEEKLLIIAMESEDTKQITEAVKNVLKNCVIAARCAPTLASGSTILVHAFKELGSAKNAAVFLANNPVITAVYIPPAAIPPP